MRLNSTNRSTLKMVVIIIVAILAIQYFFGASRVSTYDPAPIDIQAVSEKPLTSLKGSSECTDSVYSTSVGGVCGAQELVRAHANYKIM